MNQPKSKINQNKGINFFKILAIGFTFSSVTTAGYGQQKNYALIDPFCAFYLPDSNRI